MGKKYSDKVPTVGSKNLGKQKNQEVETATELAPTGKGTNKIQDNKNKNFQNPKPGEGG